MKVVPLRTAMATVPVSKPILPALICKIRSGSRIIPILIAQHPKLGWREDRIDPHCPVEVRTPVCDPSRNVEIDISCAADTTSGHQIAGRRGERIGLIDRGALFIGLAGAVAAIALGVYSLHNPDGVDKTTAPADMSFFFGAILLLATAEDIRMPHTRRNFRPAAHHSASVAQVGDLLCVAAGTEHQIEAFTELAVWVVFYGGRRWRSRSVEPEGFERGTWHNRVERTQELSGGSTFISRTGTIREQPGEETIPNDPKRS